MAQDSLLVRQLIDSFQGTLQNVLPIILVIVFFQTIVLKQKIPHLRRILFGLVLAVVGLAIFLVGLEEGIFPLGVHMADQLMSNALLAGGNAPEPGGTGQPGQALAPTYFWIYTFAFLIGFSTTLAEPALIAIALKARDISTGAISPWGLRISVAFGVAFGITLGTFRIINGTPLYFFIIAGYVALLIQTHFAPKIIVPLAYDCGGVTTSTVTVPLVTALGIGLASNLPGRSPLIDGFGLVAFASLFPMMTVLGYAMITEWLAKRRKDVSVI